MLDSRQYAIGSPMRMVVDGVDLAEQFDLLLLDGYSLTPPTPKVYTLDIPGGNGKIDLTESLFGDSVYNNRTQSFKFVIVNAESFEKTKTDVSNFLHGRAFDYKLSFDPGYTYHGRFTVKTYTHSDYQQGILGVIEITVDAEPFKKRDPQTLTIDGIGGNYVLIPSGRMKVRPVIEVIGSVDIEFGGKNYKLQNGRHEIDDIIFVNGDNGFYVNTFHIDNIQWKYFTQNSVTWGQLGTKRIYEWYRINGQGSLVFKKWSDVMVNSAKWSSLYGKQWGELMYVNSDIAYAEPVKVTYEWGDL